MRFIRHCKINPILNHCNMSSEIASLLSLRENPLGFSWQSMAILGDLNSSCLSLDCHESANADSRNDEMSVDCHAEPVGSSRNDELEIFNNKIKSKERK